MSANSPVRPLRIALATSGHVVAICRGQTGTACAANSDFSAPDRASLAAVAVFGAVLILSAIAQLAYELSASFCCWVGPSPPQRAADTRRREQLQSVRYAHL
jgi:hypothetical protein